MCPMLFKPILAVSSFFAVINTFENAGALDPPNPVNEVLDTSFPILIQDAASSDASKTLFGYSVALTKAETGKTNSPNAWVFIGAPNATFKYDSNSTNSTNRGSGAIWRCSLGFGDTDSCSIVNVDPSTGVDWHNQRPPSSNTSGNPKVEDHGGANIGITTLINHNRLITCGMNWNRGKNQFYNGICYWFADPPFSQTKPSYRANDLSNLVNTSFYDHRLMPLFTAGKDDERIFTYSKRNTQKEVFGYEWQVGQAGISAHLFLHSNESRNKSCLLIGAPGVRLWSGAVILYTNKNSAGPEKIRLNKNPEDSTFSEFVVLNRGIVPQKGINYSTVFWDEYFGYSVSSGKYLNKSEVLYASGAPRANIEGVVVIFRSPQKGEYKRHIVTVVEISAPVNSFAAYFGSVIYSADFDDNGLDELIVGAPLHSIRNSRDRRSAEKIAVSDPTKKEVDNDITEEGDNGAVYIYNFQRQNNLISSKNVKYSQMLTGSRSPYARFGSAITSIKFEFENGQSHMYLVVGAPFEQTENNQAVTGAIYLYLYDKSKHRFAQYSQRITASQFNLPLNGFGSSFSIPVDIDNNNTPDLAIGAYKSGHVVILRTRPKVSLNLQLAVTNSVGNPVQSLIRGTKDFRLRSCVKVLSTLGHATHSLKIWTRLRFADKTISFEQGDATGSNEIVNNKTFTEDVLLNAINPVCRNDEVFSIGKRGIGMENSELSEQQAVYIHPFTFVQEVWYESMSNNMSAHVILANQSVADSQQNNFTSFMPRVPASSMSQFTLNVPILNCKTYVCQPDLRISSAFFHSEDTFRNKSIKSFVLGNGPDFLVEIVIENVGEIAENSTLALEWSLTNIKESSEGRRWLKRSCKEDHSATKSKIFTDCSLVRYILPRKKHTVVFQLTTDNIYFDKPENINFTMDVQVNYGDVSKPPVRSRSQLVLKFPPTNVKIFGSTGNQVLRQTIDYIAHKFGNVVQENSNGTNTMTTFYEPFWQSFTIKLSGASISQAVADFKIPVTWSAYKNGAEQFIFVKQPKGNFTCKIASSSRFTFHSFQKMASVLALPPKPNVKTAPAQNPDKAYKQPSASRKRRDVAQTKQHNMEHGPLSINTSQAEFNKTKEPAPGDALSITCESEKNCLIFSCTIQRLKNNEAFRIPFELFLVKDKFDELLKAAEKTKAFISTSASVRIFPNFSQNKNNYYDEDVANTVLAQLGTKAKLWVYFAALGGGAFVIICLVVGLLKCGFFKRQKREELNHLKAEHHRKSMMIAAARQSTLMQGYISAETLEQCEMGKNLERIPESNEAT